MSIASESELLTIAISTVSRNFHDVLIYVKTIDKKLLGNVKFVVVSQLEDVDQSYSISHSIEVALSTDQGLSKSRNLALESCKSRWIWFQDDDINLIVDRIPNLMKFLASSSCDVVLGQIGRLENEEESYKDYSRYNVNPRFLSFRVSSIEIIARCSFVRERNIRFDESLGLGSGLPSCEENLFFYDAIVRGKGTHCLYTSSICLHTGLIESRDIDHKGRYRARGYLLGKMRSVISPLMLAWWSIRRAEDNISRISRLKLMLQGCWRSVKRRGNK